MILEISRRLKVRQIWFYLLTPIARMKMTYDMLFADLITLTFYPKEPVPASFEVK